ncbi:calpain-5-like isoform X2 [Ischnura elegans]|uniref:calpain-5-like isoform X2 n=1 Tax=Ischnura elegans TaxID=197161 RepID=UPI001ED8B1C5|nr:calpain-5-like isoform X2 [Ischnura elegans]
MVGGNKFVPFKGQKYKQLKDKHAELGTLFTDPIFPPTLMSVFRTKSPIGNIIWKRPQEVREEPTMLVENAHFNIIKGKIGKPWFVTACYALSNAQELWNKVIPNYRSQNWEEKDDDNKGSNYCGIFHFHFWHFGKWVDVVVDDLLPALSVAPTAPGSPSSSQEPPEDSQPPTLLSTCSSRPNEFWIPLVEKAYAKLLGSYEALEVGTLKDVLVDFTGGVSEEVSLSEASTDEEKAHLFRTLNHEIQEHSIVCCTVDKDDDGEDEGARSEVGLVQGRMYIVTESKRISLNDTKLSTLLKGKNRVALVRLKDPVELDVSGASMDVGNAEDNGGDGGEEEAQSDSGVYVYPPSKLRRLFSKSPEWSRLTDKQMTRLGLHCRSSNEFWIPWDDLAVHACTFTVCRLFNTNVFALGKTWKERVATGKWSRGAKGTSADRSGGGTAEEYPETFLRNPQFLFEVSVAEEDIVFQLLQWASETLEDLPTGHLPIGITVFQVEENRKCRMHALHPCCPIVIECKPSCTRELYHRGHFVKGRYLLVPSTAIPGDMANFYLRVFSSNSDIKLRELKRDYPRFRLRLRSLLCCAPSIVFVTCITIKRAEALEKFKCSQHCDPYCVVKCEGYKEKTAVVRSTCNPSWDTSFTFYRHRIDKPIVIRVYHYHVCLPAKFVGEAVFPAPVNHQWTEIWSDLIDRKGRQSTIDNEDSESLACVRGRILVEILTEDDVMAI